MRATTAAASAGSSTAGPVVATPGVTPENGALRTNVRAASPPATIHTIVERRRTGMPSEQGAVLVLGRRPHGDADVGAQQEPGQPERAPSGTTSTMRISSPRERLHADVDRQVERDVERRR